MRHRHMLMAAVNRGDDRVQLTKVWEYTTYDYVPPTTNFTLNSVDFGPEFPDRAIIVACVVLNTYFPIYSEIGSASIDGSSATLMYLSPPYTTVDPRAQFFGRYVPTGTSGTIVVNRSGTNEFSRISVSVYSARNLQSLTPYDAAYSTSGGTLIATQAVNLNVDSGGAVLAAAVGEQGNAPTTYSGFTVDTIIENGAIQNGLHISGKADRLAAQTARTIGATNIYTISAISLR